MQLRPEISIHAMIKSLTDAVLPAVDPNNKLAVEQLQLSIGLLSMMEQRMPLEFKFDCDELDRLLGFAAEIKRHAKGGEALADLVASEAKGADVRRRAQASPAEVVAAVHALRESGGALAASAYREGTPEQRAAVMKTVLSMSEQQLLRDRAWVMPQGWEAQPELVPSIEKLLG
jgi:hypothetical protein